MNYWKIAFFICLTLWILTLVCGTYIVINQAASYGYLSTSYEDKTQANTVLSNLIVKGSKNYTKKDFLVLLRKAYPKEFIAEEDNKIIMGFNVFEFENDRLIKAQ